MSIANIGLLILLAVGPTLLAIFGFNSAGALFLVSIALILLVANVSPDRYEELALGPLKAKLRQKLAEADELSLHLRNTIRLTLSIAVIAALRTGRFAFETGKLQKQVYEQTLEVARSAKLTDAEMEPILSAMFNFFEIDMRHLIIGNIMFRDPESERLRKAINDESALPPVRLRLMRELAQREGGDVAAIEDWLKDYEELTANRRLRRPDIWWAPDERRHDDFIIKHKSAVGSHIR